MKKLPEISKLFNDSTPETQSQIVENVYQKVVYINPLASVCNDINQKQVRVCPKCGKSHYILNGTRKAIQYFQCKSCGRNFNEFSGTTISYIKKKDKIKTYIFFMLLGSSIKQCSISLKISIQTSFDWRHKILASIRNHVPKEYSGITEMIHEEVKFSRKGQGSKNKKFGQKGKIIDTANIQTADSLENIENKPLSLVAMSDRNRNFEITIVQQGELQIESLKQQVNKKLNKVKKLCLEENSILKQFAGKKKISYYVKQKDKKVKGRNKYYNTDTIRSKYLKLDSFMERFKGVSSSYLQNYLNWYMILEQIFNQIDASVAMLVKSISVINGKESYKNCKMFAL